MRIEDNGSQEYDYSSINDPKEEDTLEHTQDVEDNLFDELQDDTDEPQDNTHDEEALPTYETPETDHINNVNNFVKPDINTDENENQHVSEFDEFDETSNNVDEIVNNFENIEENSGNVDEVSEGISVDEVTKSSADNFDDLITDDGANDSDDVMVPKWKNRANDEYAHVPRLSRRERRERERQRKKRQKITAVALAFILALVGGLVFVFANNNSDDEITASEELLTSVPEAVVFIAEDDDVDPCTVFSDVSLSCEVVWTVSDTNARGSLIEQSIEAGSEVENGSHIVLTYSSGPAESEFPNLNGLHVDDAREKLYEIGVTVSEINMVDGAGKAENIVLGSSVEEGATVTNGSEVVLDVSNGKVTVPDWTGKTEEFVKADAKQLGISVVFKEEESEEVTGLVLSQTPKAGETEVSTDVEVVISKAFESEEIIVPDVIGKGAEEAQIELATAGFRHIKTVNVKNFEVTEIQVTQVIPAPGQYGNSEENIVIIVSEPAE